MGQSSFLAAGARIAVLCAVVGLVEAPRAAQAETPSLAVRFQLNAFEQAIANNPEDLRLGAEYRQLAISAGVFDRATDFFEHLAKRAGASPNLLISLALSYADKVPQA